MPQRNVTARIGGWSARRPWWAIGLWVAAVVVAVLVGGAIGTQKLTDSDQGAGESLRAQQAIGAKFTNHPTENVLISSPRLVVTDAAFQAAIRDVAGRVSATGQTLNLQSPTDPVYRNQVTPDRHSAVVQFQVNGSSQNSDPKVSRILRAVGAAAAANPSLRIAESGDASINKALNDTIGKDFKRAELLSVPITLIVLILAFGALVAALVPLSLALTAIVMATGLLALTSHLSRVDSTANSVTLLIGLAVGVDYSLFIIKREREERRSGRTTSEAVATASATSGRSVLISGITVLVAMSGLFLTGDKTFIGIAQGTMLVVAAAIVGSLTVLPAMLSLLGDRIDAGRPPLVGRWRHADGESRLWGAVLDRVLRRPLLFGAAALAVLVLLGLPTLRIHTATPGATDIPHTVPVLKTYDQLQRLFPGDGLPAVAVVEAADVTAPAVQNGIRALIATAVARGAVNQPTSVRVNDDRTAALLELPLAGTGENARSVQALSVLRHQVIPRTVGAVPGVRVNVTGFTAGSTDFNSLLRHRLPLVFGFVLVLAFLLLLFSFRSLVIALTAIVLNLLSVFAAYGVLVVVFQWGWGQSLLGFTSVHAVTSWLPLFLFVVLFGLSMDYHVFILSRIREAYDRGSSSAVAIERGIKTTAGVVTTAAVVMVFVFLIFATLSQISLKALGVGLAVAILLDATVVRGVLLPAVMLSLGDRNWYLPSWLGRLAARPHEPAGNRPAVITLPDATRSPVRDA